jgi:hypothetical protein
MGDIENTNVNIRKYISRLTQRKFNPRFKRFEIAFLYTQYDKHRGICKMPRYNLDHFVKMLVSKGVNHKVFTRHPYEGSEVEIPMDSQYSPRPNQVDSINFLVNNPTDMRGLALQTGQGKSYCSIKATSELRRRGIIFVSGLAQQWEDAIYQFTTLREGEVYLIQGFDSIAKLHKNIPWPTPKFYVASTRTIRNYVTDNANYSQFKPFNDFLKYLDVGVKIVDECHTNFSTNTTIDLNTNIKHNLYLSATYGRNDNDGKRIFEIVFPKNIRFGEGNYDKYVNIYSYSYNIGNNIPEKVVLTPQGYSQAKYEKFILKRQYLQALYFSKLFPIIESHFFNIRRVGQKLLILVGLKDMATQLMESLYLKYPYMDLNINTYFSDTEDEILDESDIIISTVGSCGVGRDIGNLRTTIVTNSFNAFTLNKQTLGRLRKLKNGDTPHFIYITNENIQAQMNHRYQRKKIFQPLGLKYTELSV